MPLSNFENTFATTFHTVAQAPGGVARLRELILTLAVQGKLVAQDASDEPASDLLKKIRSEKDRLIAEGKIKKDKPLAVIAEEEKPFELPVGWEWVRLGALTELITSGSRDWAEYYSDIGPIFLRMGNLSKGSYRLRLSSLQHVIPPKGGEGSRTSLIENDLLLSITGDVGMLGLIPKNFGEAYINQHTCLIRWMEILRNEFFPMQMLSNAIQDQLNAPQRGVKNSFRLSDVSGVILVLPPLAEQSRIVARVEELMRLCDALEEKGRLEHTQHQQLLQAMLDSLTQTTDAHELARHWQRLAQHFDLLIDRPEAVDALEQTILQLAVRGLLVEQKENEDPLQISSSNEALSTHNLNGPFGINIPKGWRIYSLLELGKISGGKTPSTQNNNYWDGDVPWITPKDMKFEILEGSLDKVTKEALKDGLTLYPADSVLMVVRSGILRRIFPVALSKVDFTVNQDLKVLVPDLKISEYLVLMLKGFEREILRDLTKIGTTVESIQFDKFSKFQFPIPPLSEQSRIVARVTELRTLCQQLREKLTQARTTQTQLAQAWVEQVAA